ncbi:hypothetical protein Tco_0227557 [Tanacetum coccineum]
MSDSRGSILGLTAARALVSIQEMADHSHKYESYNEIYYGDNCLSNEELKCIQASESGEDELRITPCNNLLSDNRPNLEETFRGYLEESCKRQDIFDEWMKRFRENTNKNLRRHDSAIKGLEEKVVRLAQAVATYDKLNQDKALDRKNSMIISPLSVDSNLENAGLHQIFTRAGVKEYINRENVLQNELPPKEKDLRSFVLPCTIGNTTVINALADLGASICVMPFLVFKRLGLGSTKPISMVINNEDDKVPIIPGRPMLATAYVRIDVFSRKISLEVPDNFRRLEDLEGFLMDDDINGDLGNFLKDNDLLPGIDMDSFGAISDSENGMGLDWMILEKEWKIFGMIKIPGSQLIRELTHH